MYKEVEVFDVVEKRVEPKDWYSEQEVNSCTQFDCSAEAPISYKCTTYPIREIRKGYVLSPMMDVDALAREEEKLRAKGFQIQNASPYERMYLKRRFVVFKDEEIDDFIDHSSDNISDEQLYREARSTELIRNGLKIESLKYEINSLKDVLSAYKNERKKIKEITEMPWYVKIKKFLRGEYVSIRKII